MQITEIDAINAEVLNGLTVNQVASITEAHKELHTIWRVALDKTIRLLAGLKEALPNKNWMAFCKHCLPSNLNYKTVQRMLRSQEFVEATAVPQPLLAEMSSHAVAQIAAAPADIREVIEAELIETGKPMTIAAVEQKLGKQPPKATATQRIVALEEQLATTQAENDRLRLENQQLRQQLEDDSDLLTPEQRDLADGIREHFNSLMVQVAEAKAETWFELRSCQDPEARKSLEETMAALEDQEQFFGEPGDKARQSYDQLVHEAMRDKCVGAMLDGIHQMATVKAALLTHLDNATDPAQRAELQEALDKVDGSIPDTFTDPDDADNAALAEVIRTKLNEFTTQILEDQSNAE